MNIIVDGEKLKELIIQGKIEYDFFSCIDYSKVDIYKLLDIDVRILSFIPNNLLTVDHILYALSIDNGKEWDETLLKSIPEQYFEKKELTQDFINFLNKKSESVLYYFSDKSSLIEKLDPVLVSFCISRYSDFIFFLKQSSIHLNKKNVDVFFESNENNFGFLTNSKDKKYIKLSKFIDDEFILKALKVDPYILPKLSEKFWTVDNLVSAFEQVIYDVEPIAGHDKFYSSFSKSFINENGVRKELSLYPELKESGSNINALNFLKKKQSILNGL